MTRDTEEGVRLTMPLPPNILNQRKHWRAKIRQKKAYWKRLTVLRATEGWPKGESPDKATISVTAYVWNLMDADNLMARLKWTLDWLIAWDYLPDDSPRVLEWDGMPTQEIDRRNQRLEIEIRDAA